MFDFIFPTPSGMQPQMLFWIFLAYGYVLFSAAQLLSEGSELLLLVPSIAGLVGSVVLPVLGAVPDGMMMLFSGLGDTEKAQESVAVGVGALAGSTIMLLTIPWFLGVLGGRVDIIDGKPAYNQPPAEKLNKTGLVDSLFGTGIRYKPEIKLNAWLMMITSLTYLVIQFPAYLVDSQHSGHISIKEIHGESSKEGAWALIGMVVCLAEFTGYLYVQYALNLPEETNVKNSSAEILKAKFAGCLGWVRGLMDSAGVSMAPNRNYASALVRAQELGIKVWMAEFRKEWKLTGGSAENNRALLDRVIFPKAFRDTLAMWFRKYADPTTSRISVQDFNNLLRDLFLTGYSGEEIFKQVDANSDGDIDLEEFQECFKYLASLPPIQDKNRRATIQVADVQKSAAAANAAPDSDDEEAEQEDIPEEWRDLDADEQRRQILMRSCYKMGLGTLLVLVFSDPMVDVLGEIGVQSGIPAFYISFVLAPLASNSSELVAAFNYAQKKTSKTITISLNTLEGAACMNNTFCLGIFMGLVYFQGLAWKFTAETVSILLVQFIMAGIVLMADTQRLILACGILMLFPGALAFVYFMENVLHLD